MNIKNSNSLLYSPVEWSDLFNPSPAIKYLPYQLSETFENKKENNELNDMTKFYIYSLSLIGLFVLYKTFNK